MTYTKKNDPITWLQFNNAIPLVGTLITAIFFFATLQSDIKLGSERDKELSDDVKEVKEQVSKMTENITIMGQDIVAIKTTLGIRQKLESLESSATPSSAIANFYTQSLSTFLSKKSDESGTLVR